MAVQKFPLNFDCRDIAMEALIAAQEASDRGEERDSGGGGEKEQNKGAGGEKEQDQGAEGAMEQGAEGEKKLRRRCCELQEQLDEAKSEGAVAQVRGGNSSGVGGGGNWRINIWPFSCCKKMWNLWRGEISLWRRN